VGTPDLKILTVIELESGVNEQLEGFCSVRAIAEDGTVMYGQLDPATCRQQAQAFMEVAEGAVTDAMLVKLLTEDVGLDEATAGQVLVTLRGMRGDHDTNPNQGEG